MLATTTSRASARSDAGFSFTELLVATTVMLLISGVVSQALKQMADSQKTIWNRTEMHSGVRGATELLQQEVGQAGRPSTPTTITLVTAVATGSQTVSVTSTSNLFVGEQVVVDGGSSQETVALTAINQAMNQITGVFANPHAAGAVVRVIGGFSAGVVPPTMTNGSTGTVLKLFGDLNDDGNMVYVEYTCDTNAHNLYRNVMAWNLVGKPAVTASNVLLGNVIANPGNTACFTYQTATVNGNTYVLDVAITLTVQTQLLDPITRQYQTETKALLNVSPRNVFNAWELASLGLTNRIQPMPASIQALLP